MNLPTSWESVTIGESLDLINGRAFKPKEWSTAGRPIIRIQNLNNPKAAFNYYVGELPEKFSVATGDLLFAWSGTPGTSFGAHIWKGPDAWLNQHIFKVIFPRDVFDKTFLQFAINQNLAQYIGVAHGGAGLAHITKGKFEASSLPLPPLSEQKRIVAKIEELFSELEAGEESLRAARRQLGVYRQSLLKQAFEGKLTETWRAENPDKLESPAQLLARIQAARQARYEQQLKDWETALAKWEKSNRSSSKPRRPSSPDEIESLSPEILNDMAVLPSGWFWGRLGTMTLSVQYGTAAKSSKTGECPVIRMGNLQGGEIDWEDLVFTSDKNEIEQYRLQTGDVLFNRTNSPELVGKTAIYRGNRPAVFAGYLIRINHVPSIISSGYLNYFLNSAAARNYGNSVKTDGVNQSNINGAKLMGYPFPYCSLPEQQEIVRLLDEQFEAIERNEREIDAALKRSEALRQSILKKAFSGQLVPQDPSDEPASALLERIAKVSEASASKPVKTKAVRKVNSVP